MGLPPTTRLRSGSLHDKAGYSHRATTPKTFRSRAHCVSHGASWPAGSDHPRNLTWLVLILNCCFMSQIFSITLSVSAFPFLLARILTYVPNRFSDRSMASSPASEKRFRPGRLSRHHQSLRLDASGVSRQRSSTCPSQPGSCLQSILHLCRPHPIQLPV